MTGSMQTVVARVRRARGNPVLRLAMGLDCFASLAMTARVSS